MKSSSSELLIQSYGSSRLGHYNLNIYLFVCLFVRLFVCLFIYLFIYFSLLLQAMLLLLLEVAWSLIVINSDFQQHSSVHLSLL